MYNGLMIITPPRSFFKKTIPLILAVMMIYTLVAFVLDQHYDGDHQNCPICIAKVLLNGTQNSIIVTFNPMIAYHCPVEKLFDIVIPASLPFKDRAPPALRHG